MGSTDNGPHFVCAKCGRERETKHELSHVSKSISRTPRFRGLKAESQKGYMLCRYCANGTPLPPALANYLANREYWERKVSESELKSPKPVEPAKVDRIVSLVQASTELGIPKSTIYGWVQRGWVKEAGRRGDVALVSLRDVQTVARERTEGTSRQGSPHGYRAVRNPVSPEYRKKVAQKLLGARAIKGVTQQQVADEIGVSNTTISNIELQKEHVTKNGLDLAETWADLVLLEIQPEPEGPVRLRPKEVIIRHPQTPPPPNNRAPWDVEDERKKLARQDKALDAIAKWRAEYKQLAPDWTGWAALDSCLESVGR